MHLTLPSRVGRLLGALADARPIAMAAPRPRSSTPSPGGWPPPNPLPAEQSMRLAREDALLDQQAKVECLLGLPEAQGLERMAAVLAGTDATLEEARLLLRAAQARPGASTSRRGSL